MKAVTATKYGPPEVLQIVDVPKPQPAADEVLIQIKATSVHIGDTKIRRLQPGLGPVKDFFFKPIMRVMMGFRGPRKSILGMELAGIIEEVGSQVTRFEVGDEVFAATEMQFGAYAEYIAMKESKIIGLKPQNLSFEEAATVPNGAMTALMILRKGGVKSGDNMLIYGASGSVGTFAVQLANAFGARVTGVCSTDNVEMVKSIGADRVIDYKNEDVTQLDEKFDVVFDAYGHADKQGLKSLLKPSGTYLNVLTTSDGLKMTVEGLEELKSIIEQGKLQPVIDRKYTLDQMVEAHRYVDKGHKKGNVAVKVAD